MVAQSDWDHEHLKQCGLGLASVTFRRNSQKAMEEMDLLGGLLAWGLAFTIVES